MSVIIRVFARLCLLVAFAVTASAQTPNARNTGGGTVVCVASALGHRFEVKTVGIMVFGNAYDSAPATGWGVDDFVVRRTGALLGSRYSVRRLTFPNVDAAGSSGGLLFSSSQSTLPEILRAAAAGGRCDYYLAVTRWTAPVGGTNQSISGLGVLKYSNHRAFAMIHLRLFDPNFSVLKAKYSANDGLFETAAGLGLRGMYQNIDESMWPASAQAALRDTRLRDILLALVDKGLKQAIPDLL